MYVCSLGHQRALSLVQQLVVCREWALRSQVPYSLQPAKACSTREGTSKIVTSTVRAGRSTLAASAGMAQPASKPAIGVLGVPPRHSSVPEHMRDFIAEAVAQTPGNFEKAGYKCELIEVLPEDTVEQLTANLAVRHLDGVVVGFGVRGLPPNTYLFEKVIEAIRQGLPHAKIMFNTTPEDSVDAAKRWLPIDA